MYRRKEGREYYTIPGGGAQPGETPAEAAVREAKEETGLDVRIDRELFREENDRGEHHYFLVHPAAGEPVLGGEEALLSCAANFYRLDWVPLADLADVNLITPDTKNLLLQALKARAPEQV